MIGIKLSGGLGNNMFEYAAAKSLAKSKKLRFCYFSIKSFGFYLKKLKKKITIILKGEIDLPLKQLSKNDLSTYFKIEENFFTLTFNRIIWNFNIGKKKKSFHYQWNDSKKANIDQIRSDFYSCKEWTELKGCFASELFFLRREFVLKWFTPVDFYNQKIQDIEKNFYFPKEKRCCIHIRRGDALFTDKGCAYKDLGWGLPKSYYDYVLKKLDKNLLFIFVSDDPQWALDKFDYLPNKIFLKDNSEVVDMFIFTKCKYNIISRGTFSWWGAWLNQIPNKVVYAPKYFLGLNQKKCFPIYMDKGEEVSKWKYVDISKI